jgi:hypothetical protein
MAHWRAMCAGLAVWLLGAGPACAQTEPMRWFEFAEPVSARPTTLLGEGVPPAILLLDMSVPPGISGAAPFGESALWAPKRPIQNGPGYLGEFRQDASVGGPLFSSDVETLVGFIDARNTQFHTDVFLRDSQRPFPNQLWELVAGLSYSRRTENGWTVGGSVSVGSPSDRPFNSFREVMPSATAFVRMPAAREGDAWLYSVSWAPVSLIRFPLPGVAYEWNPSEQLQIVAGVPLSMTWRPTEYFRFDLGYMPPQQTRMQATYEIVEHVDVFAGFEWVNEAYLLDDRVHWRDFFYSYEKRLPAGMRIRFGDNCLLDIAGGYLFNRIYFTSRTFTDESRDRVHVAPSAFGMVRFALVF